MSRGSRPPVRTGQRSASLVGAVFLAAAVLLLASGLTSPGTDRDPASKVLLDESFDGDQLDTAVWNTCHWWDDEGCTISSNDELEWYLPEQVSVSGGALELTAEPRSVEASDGKTYPFRSGMVTTGPTPDGAAKLAWTYGTVEARLRVPAGRGLWPALWMLPADEESRPEIDILEVLGDDPAELVMHFHPEDREAESPSERYRLEGSTFADDWHTVRLEWLPGRVTWFVDDVAVWDVTGDQVPAEPMYLVLNLAVGGVYPGSPDETTEFPATFAIDHVRITAA